MAYNNSHSVMLGHISSYLCRCCREAYEQGRADAIDEVIKKLAESEDTILSDIQYYTLIELKEKKNESIRSK